jgi:hypothetical protein
LLFKKTGLAGGLYSLRNGKELLLVAYSGGMTGRGELLGYAYCGQTKPAAPDSLPPCMGNGDSFSADNYRYEKIDERWYIFDEY